MVRPGWCILFYFVLLGVVMLNVDVFGGACAGACTFSSFRKSSVSGGTGVNTGASGGGSSAGSARSALRSVIWSFSLTARDVKMAPKNDRTAEFSAGHRRGARARALSSRCAFSPCRGSAVWPNMAGQTALARALHDHARHARVYPVRCLETPRSSH